MLKVAIIGKLPSKWEAFKLDESYEIWGCNLHSDLPKFEHRITRWFDIHKNISSYNENISSKLITRDKYPLEKVIDLLGGNYLNNSISYMVMYAVLLNAVEIRLYGIALSNGEEIRTKQRENLENILFYCKGKGIKVWSIEPSIMPQLPLYGA